MERKAKTLDFEELRKELQDAVGISEEDLQSMKNEEELLSDHSEQFVLPEEGVGEGEAPAEGAVSSEDVIIAQIPEEELGSSKEEPLPEETPVEETPEEDAIPPAYDMEKITAAVMASQEQAAIETEARVKAEAATAKKKRKRKKTAKRLGVTILLLLLLFGVAIGAYMYMSRYYETHFFSGTTINGVDVSGMTAAEVKKDLLGVPDTYKLTILERDGMIEELVADDLGRSYVDNNQVEQILASQDAGRWLFSGSEEKDYEVRFDTDYDEDMAQQAVERLACISGGGIISPQDATLATDESGKYYIVPEVQGNKVNENKLKELIIAAVDAKEETIDLEASDCYEKPKVLSTDEGLKKRMDDWNAFLSVNVTYKFGPNEEKIDGNTVAPYISDDGETVSIATDWVKTLVHEWSVKYETFGMEREFKTHDGITILIPGGGDYGWCLNDERMVEDIIQAVETGATGEREPIWLYEAWGWDNGDLTGSYAEVSIVDQKLWVYKDYEVVVETDVKTGLPNGDMDTNPGCFAIDGKKKDAVLGTFVTHGYSLPVQWWLPFDGEIGLHDAPWAKKFGGTEYKTSGSNGCVNIPVEEMEAVFKNLEIGMAVVVYNDKTPYIPDASSAADIAQAAVEAEANANTETDSDN